MSTLQTLTRYKSWANGLIYSALTEIPLEEVLRPRQTRFGNMLHTLNHVFVIDSVFKAHLEGRPHGYTARNTPTHPPLLELREAVRALDQWYVDYASGLDGTRSAEEIDFQFIGGGEGRMSREAMILHVVNHGTYHRGFVGDMMYQAGVTPPATDLPVFFRDAVML